MAAVNTTCCFGNTTVSKCITGGVLQSVKLTGHVHVMMKSRLAVQDEDDGDGSVKSSMLWFQGHEHHSTGFCASASRSLLPEGGWIGRISSSSTCGVGCMTTSWSWGMSAAAAARLVIDLLFTH